MARSVLVLVPWAAVAAGCGFSLHAEGDDQVVEGREITIEDTAAADFTGTRSDATIAARGAIEPDAFVVGGLHARAFTGSVDRDTYDAWAAAVGQARGEGYHQLPYDFGDTEGRPKGLGIDGGDFYTILYDGEIYLPGGQLDLSLDADDVALVEIALDGETFATSVRDRYNTEAPHVPIAVPADGWYPIRAAFTEAVGNSRFHLYYTPAGGAQVHVDANQTRARVSDAHGLIANAFRYRWLLEPRGTAAVQTIDADFGYSEPRFDLGLPVDEFGVRYAGQLRIDDEGDYTFTADATTSGSNGGDLWRIWIDGTAIAGPWMAAPTTNTATVTLTPGWHDLLVDFGDDNGDARIRVRMAGPNVADGPIDPARLRPAMATGLTAPYANLSTSHRPITDAGSAPTTTRMELPLAGPTDATILAFDWGLGIENARMTDLSAVRIDCDPDGTPVPLGAQPGYIYTTDDATCASSHFPLAWSYDVTDAVNGGSSGAIYNPILVATYRGGDTNVPFAKVATFTSTPRPTANAIGFGRVAIDREARGQAIELALRTAADEAGLASAAWVPVADGEVPSVAPGGVVQYRVTIESDGWTLPSVERVAITYVVPE